MPFLRVLIILIFAGNVAHARANPAESCLHALSDGDADTALAQAEQALVQQQNQRDLLLCKGRAELNLGRGEDALKSFTAAELQAKTGNERMVTDLLKGNAYKALGQFAQAQSSYEAALALAVQEKNQKFQVISNLLAGEAAMQQEQLPQAQEYYEAALRLAGNNNERADANEHLAQLKAKQGLYDNAIEHQVKALVMQTSDGSFDAYANAGLELGYLYIGAKDFNNAERSLNKIIDKAREAEDGYWTAKGYYYLGLNFIAAKQADKARDALNEAREIGEAIGAEKLTAEVNLQLQNLSQH
ncbi:Tetratricopeptide repeat-containing protein [Methylobacillus rhizosphaerae]|uniref:Tetratricopeptide repeat-containing protein n=1 Tax=Methylobacillus rhizosphaerae TaxID=551994 RepID=A0A238YMC8_9PROT|nr:tetratricopeptide repeat protein [Methylobacillus rhizosphaerae]SNR72287.1 Tetratricopeptide repeat-containing protein [Methylobacillus rhizosphaerae]